MPATKVRHPVEERDAVTIRFAGDASDGMHLVGSQFASASAHHGNLVATLPDPAAEIRAPAGTLAGVSGLQVSISGQTIHAPGDQLDALVAMNPAALKAHLADLAPGGLLIVNADTYLQEEWEKAGYLANPLHDGSLSAYRLLPVPMNQLNREAVSRVNLSPREAERSKSFFVLGLACWFFDRPFESILRWIRDTYIQNPAMIEANTRTLKAGYQWATGVRPPVAQVRIAKATLAPGRYRTISGTEALALGLLTAAEQTKLPLVFASSPVAPASGLLHQLFEKKHVNLKVIQAEDDLAAINLALGASFGGAVGVTATTGSGLSLQSEALALAVMSELPCVIIDVQRAGPSTGMPTRSEQSDLSLALHGRNGDCPLIVLAMATPADGFAIVLDAVRLAIRYMTPVIVLADLYLAGASETWRVPSREELPEIEVQQATASSDTPFLPYERDARGARPWAVPGTRGLEHRVGGLEKEPDTGNVSYDPEHHKAMVLARENKIQAQVANDIPPLDVFGPEEGEVLVVGWGSTQGVIRATVERFHRKKASVTAVHFRHLNPLPANTPDVLRGFRYILVPEVNRGQFAQVIQMICAESRIESLILPYTVDQNFAGCLARLIEECLQREPAKE